MTSRSLLRVAAGLNLLGAACAPGDALPHFGTLQYESESLEVWASDGLRACGGTYPYTEAWLEAFRRRTKRDRPGPHVFYWASQRDFERDGACETAAPACAHAGDGVAYSTLIPMEHELVHLELAAADPPVVFAEGAAEMFGSIQPTFAQERVEIDSLLDSELVSDGAYATAGRFSRFLVDQYGLEAYFAMHDRLDDVVGSQAIDVGFQDVFGVELLTVVEDFEAFPVCPIESWRFYDVECSDAAVVLWQSEARWAVDVELACTSDDVIGPRGGRTWALRALEVPTAGPYRVRIDSEDDTARALLVPCRGGCYAGSPPATFATTDRVYAGTSGAVTVQLDAGRYWMRVGHDAAVGDVRATVSVERAE